LTWPADERAGIAKEDQQSVIVDLVDGATSTALSTWDAVRR
jgi:hypothetical protein